MASMSDSSDPNSSMVEATSRVLADITVKLKDGSIADSTKVSGKPSWLIMGNGSFSAAFEAQLMQRQVGEQLVFELSAADAFGPSNPDAIDFMDISQFPQDIELKVGAIIGFEQANGDQLPGIIRAIEGASVKVDFNHPLAGEDVIFEIDIKQIESPSLV